MNKFISISTVIEEAWELSKKHGLLLAVLFFAIYIVTNTSASFVMSTNDMMEYANAIQQEDFSVLPNYIGALTFIGLVQQVINIILMTGLTIMFIRIARGTLNAPDFSVYKQPTMTYFKFFAVTLIVNIIFGIGYCCCILPGIFLQTRLIFAPVYILDHPEKGVGDAISASWRMTEGNFWSLLGLGICVVLMNLVGVCFCCVGVFFTMVIAEFCLVIAYLTLHPDEEQPIEEYVKDEYNTNTTLQ